MTDLLRSLNTTQNRGLALATNSNENSTRGQRYYQQSPSLAETPISRYSGGSNNDGDTSNSSCTVSNNNETRTHPDTSLQHSYDTSQDFISRFPIGFEGCVSCGQKYHRNTRECTSAKADNFDKHCFLLKCGHINPILRYQILNLSINQKIHVATII